MPKPIAEVATGLTLTAVSRQLSAKVSCPVRRGRTPAIVRVWIVLAVTLALTGLARAQETPTNTAPQVFAKALTQIAAIIQPATNGVPRTLATTLRVLKAEGLSKAIAGREVELAFQAPDRVMLSAKWDGREYRVARDGQEVWVHVPAKKFGLIGTPETPLYATDPQLKETKALGPLKLPIRAEQLAVLPFLTEVKALPEEAVGTNRCQVLTATPRPEAIEALNLPKGTVQLWIRTNDTLPLRLGYRDTKGTDLLLEFENPTLSEAWPASRWKMAAAEGDKVEKVARAHLTRFMEVAIGMLGERIPTLGPATGERRVIAREGNGRLEMIDGTRVLVLKGTPEEMGHQHGTLLKKDVRRLVDHMLFGVGVGSSFDKGTWVFGEIEAVQKRLNPFMDERYYREMDALATAAGLPREEVRLANFFPELFHCSGFALFGKATVDGRMYHGRILDYLRGLGLEQNAAVIVLQPDKGNAWVNVGYAGFIGSVTAMNEKQVAIGEMGGRGEGNWDGKPMAQLVREVMEKANTLEEAVEIMRKGPRTCEYFYVISDAKSKKAVGIAATPSRFELVLPGKSHPQLPHPIEDAVLMSAGDRYEELATRVKEGYRKFDAEKSRDLMKRPVCMTSNIHCALFAPDTLDFWVANADSESVAAHARYTRYNLRELMEEPKVQ